MRGSAVSDAEDDEEGGVPSVRVRQADLDCDPRLYLRAVCDMIRCSAIYETLAELRDGLRRLKDDPAVNILQVKNRFDPAFDVSILGYRDLKMLVTLPEVVSRGYVAEVQLHLKLITLVKSGEGHAAYVHARDALGG